MNKTMQCQTPGCTNEKHSQRANSKWCTECLRKLKNKTNAANRKKKPGYFKKWYQDFKKKHGVTPMTYRAKNKQKVEMVRANLASMGLLK